MEQASASYRGAASYIGYFLPIALACGAVFLLIRGIHGIGAIVLVILGAMAVLDRIARDDLESYRFKHPNIFVYMMWSYLPITLLAFMAFLWVLAHGHNGGDLFGLAAIVNALTGFDMLAAHANDGIFTYLIAALLFSQICAIGSVSIGHELAHRTWESFSVFAARACSLFGLFTYYAVEHPYGHHQSVGTSRDSSTALRGESVYTYFMRTSLQDYQIAWDIEKERLEKMGQSVWSIQNRLLQGWTAEILLLIFITAVSGFLGLFWFLFAALNTHFGYKMGTYGQHYGIIRVPDSEIKVHHSWDCYNRFTNWFVDGIGRHAHHHLEPNKEFWNLQAFPDAPRYPHGYLASMGYAMIPPLWHKMMAPKLKEWDEKWASPEERILAREANLKSGRPELMALANPERPHAKAA